jgi:ribosome-associated protein
LATSALEDKQGRDIRVLDVRGRSSVTDYFLLATGNSPPHLKALSNAVDAAMRDAHTRPYRKAGDPEGGWLLLDCLDVIIHVFSPEAREYYGLETLWAQDPTESHPA